MLRHTLRAATTALVFGLGSAQAGPAAQAEQAAADQAARPAPIPAEAIFRQDAVPTVAMSPDGLRLAALVNGDEGEEGLKGQDRVIIVDLATMTPQLTIPLGEYPVRRVSWASKQHLLIGVDILDDYRGETYRVGTRMVTMNVDTTQMAVMFENQKRTMRRNRYLGSVVNMLPGDPDHVLMTAATPSGNHLWRVNVTNGAAEVQEKGRDRTIYWFTETDGRAVIRIDANRSFRYLYVYTRTDEDEWKKVRTVRVGGEKDEDDRDFWPVAPAPGEDRYYVLAHPDDEEFRTIKVYDYGTNEYVETVIDAGDADVRYALTSAETGELIGARVLRDRIETVLLDKRAQAHIRGLDAYFENDANIRFWGGSKDGRYALLFVSAPTNPGEFWVYDYEKATVSYLLDDKEGIDRAALGPMEVMDYTARDGTALSAYVTHPPGVAPGAPAPLVVMVHGGPEGRDVYDFDRGVQYLASRGYRVLQPYFRGSSGRGRSFAEAGYGQWGGVMQDDVTDAVRTVQDRGLASPATTCIVGASYGGYAALYGGATTPERYACVASLAGVTDLRAQMRFDRNEHGRDSEAYTYWLQSIGDPRADKDKLDRTSPVTFAASYPLPVHLAHGEEDSNVPVEQSRKMAKALKKANRPYEYHEYEDEEHTFYEWETDQAYWKSLSTFLAGHIGGQP